MGAPKVLLEAMRDDTHVLAIIASIPDAPFTEATVSALAHWFDDVEIHYPIPEMAFEPEERRKIIHVVSTEMLEHFAKAVNDAAIGELSDEAFKALAQAVDPLWRELTGAFAAELNIRFEDNRVPADSSQEFLDSMMGRLRENFGDEAVNEFRSAIIKDTNLRAHLRRIGIDPDAAK